MARPTLSRPTDGDIEILKVLWEHGPLSVRDIHEKMGPSRKGAVLNSILKRTQIMEEKGYVTRELGTRPLIYRPTLPKQSTQRSLLADLVKRVFSGSATSLILNALGTSKVSREELAQIRQLLESRAAKN